MFLKTLCVVFLYTFALIKSITGQYRGEQFLILIYEYQHLYRTTD